MRSTCSPFIAVRDQTPMLLVPNSERGTSTAIAIVFSPRKKLMPPVPRRPRAERPETGAERDQIEEERIVDLAGANEPAAGQRSSDSSVDDVENALRPRFRDEMHLLDPAGPGAPNRKLKANS